MSGPQTLGCHLGFWGLYTVTGLRGPATTHASPVALQSQRGALDSCPGTALNCPHPKPQPHQDVDATPSMCNHNEHQDPMGGLGNSGGTAGHRVFHSCQVLEVHPERARAGGGGGSRIMMTRLLGWWRSSSRRVQPGTQRSTCPGQVGHTLTAAHSCPSGAQVTVCRTGASSAKHLRRPYLPDGRYLRVLGIWKKKE